MGYIRDAYHVPAKRGSRVSFDGLPGTIISARSCYLRLRLDDGRRVTVHPTWEMEYDTPGAFQGIADGGCVMEWLRAQPTSDQSRELAEMRAAGLTIEQVPFGDMMPLGHRCELRRIASAAR